MSNLLVALETATKDAETEQTRLDLDLLRAQKALDFRDPTRRMFGKIEGEMWNFFANTAMDSGYNFRDGQYDMAEGVLKAIRDGNHLAVEAGVGIGKSFGYLVPLVLYYKATGSPVVIATSTIALQEQLASDLAALLDLLEIDEPFIVAKGQSNYICISRAKRYIDRWGQTKTAMQIYRGLQNGFADRKDYPADIPDKDWNCVNVRNYKKKDCALCAYAEHCHYYQMRQELPATGIVICNQDLLNAHFRIAEKYNTYLLNPEVSVIVIDEAHNLEGKIRFANTGHISARSLISLARSAEESVAQAKDGGISTCMQELMDAVKDLFANVQHQAIQQSKWELIKLSDSTKAAGYNYTKEQLFDLLEADRFFFRDEEGANELLYRMISKLDAFVKHHSWSAYQKSPYPTEQVADVAAVRDSLVKFSSRMNEYVVWSERNGKDWSLCFCPKNIAIICNHLFFRGNHTTILTSATMTGSGSGKDCDRYAYWAEGVGFPAGVRFPAGVGIPAERSMGKEGGNNTPYHIAARYGSYMTPIPSPFNYDEHAMIYYANDMPHPTKEHEEFLKAGMQRLREILDISEGRALVLFTSKSDMKRVAQELRKMELPYRILVQGPGSSQEDVLNAFRDDEHAVLFGTGSFWEGISVEGKTLSNLVIFRLPFSVPDPITAEKEAGKKDPLMEVRVPEMIIKLKQGVGRLIRNEDDKGIVSIIDSRMGDRSSVPYKERVWDALPIRNRTSDLEAIRRFYQEVVMMESATTES